MVRITEQLIRKKAEHNECLIGTLEEVSLHQEDIECIEHIQNWCRELKILLLQSNLISKIENVHKLKKLEYLNLAINNIERVEGLEGCESLQKLDLTLNFIGDLISIESLQGNYNLETLYFTGNPCTEYNHYRDFVIATLPQLKLLDDKSISHSERIRAFQNISWVKREILDEQVEYFAKRKKQIERVTKKLSDDWNAGGDDVTEEERTKRFWKETTEHCPETRYAMAKVQRANKKDKEEKKETPKPKALLFAKDGRPFCVNQPKVKFKFEDKEDHWMLDLSVYKFLDTSLIDVDLQPRYVRVTLKDKIFQLALQDDINISKSKCQRSQVTGHLVMNLVKEHVSDTALKRMQRQKEINEEKRDKTTSKASMHEGMSRREFLEIGSGPDDMDFSMICEHSKMPDIKKQPKKNVTNINYKEEDVPPLE